APQGEMIRVMTVQVEENMPVEQADRLLRDWILKTLQADEIDDELGFFELGMASNQMIYLRNYLREFFPEVSPTAAFDYPTIGAMADYLTTLKCVKLPVEQPIEARVMLVRAEESEDSDGFIKLEKRLSAEEAEQLLRHKIMTMLKVDEIDDELGFFEMGLVSHQMILLRNYLRDMFPDVSPVAAFDYPTIEKLGAYLSNLEWIGSEEDLPQDEPRVMVARVIEEEKKSSNDPSSITMGVISSACRLPGGCTDLAEYWDLLKTGRDSVSRIPATRIATRDVLMKGAKYGNKVEGGHYIDGVTEFDPSFFKISKNEANAMDPQQRLILEVVAECLEHSGLPKEEYSTLGVFVGLMALEYPDAVDEQSTVLSMLGSAVCVISGRISYWLGTHGPTMTVDTACSSSLVAVNEARAALASGTCTKAIVAAVNVNLAEKPMGMRVNGRMLCYDGTCKAFDARANGYGRSEGVAAILIETARPDVSYSALIPAVNVNHGGRGVSLMAPNGVAQHLLIDRVLRDSPSTVPSYWEAHGTGTGLGDPIEVNVLARLLGTVTVGSNKASIGHGEAVAGLNGVLKVLAQSEYGYIPNTLHMHCLNPEIEAKKLTFPIVGHEWEDERAIAGVSSFGVAGTNSAVLLCRPDKNNHTEEGKEAVHRTYAIPVTAKNTKSLEMLLETFETFLDQTKHRLSEVAATAALKREHYAQQRTVLICDSKGRVMKKIAKNHAKPQPVSVSIGSTSIGDGTLQLMALPGFADAFNKMKKELGITGASLYALTHLVKKTLPAATLTAADAHGQAAIDLVQGKITLDKAAGELRGSAGATAAAAAAFHSLLDFYTWAGQVFADGHNIDWRVIYPVPDRQLILPTYAFNHTTHWLGKRAEDAVFEDEHLGIRTTEGEQTRFDNSLSLLRHRQLFRLDQTTQSLYLLQKSVRLSIAQDKSFALSAFKTTDVVIEDNVWMKTVVDAKSGTVTLTYDHKEAATARFVVDQAPVQLVQLPSISVTTPVHLPEVPTTHIVGNEQSMKILDTLINDTILPAVAVVKNVAEKLDASSTISFYPTATARLPICVCSDSKSGVVQAQVGGAVLIAVSGGVAIVEEKRKDEKTIVQIANGIDAAFAAPTTKSSPTAAVSGSRTIKGNIKRLLGDILTSDEPLDEEELAGGFTEMGLDSLSMMDFVNALNGEYAELAMSSTDLYDNPTVDELAAFIMGKIGGAPLIREEVELPELKPLFKKEAYGGLQSMKDTIKTILGDILTSDELLNEEELDGGFTEMGLDSLSMMDFVNALNGQFSELSLTSIDLYDHPTINDLAVLINDKVGGSVNLTEETTVPVENGVTPAPSLKGNPDVRKKLIEILGDILTSDDPLEPEELEGGFTEMGLDSLSMMDFVNALNAHFTELSLSSTDLYDHPTVSELAALIAERMGEAAGPAPATRTQGSEGEEEIKDLPDAFLIAEVIDWDIDSDYSMVIDAGKVAFRKGSALVLPGDIGDAATISVDLEDILSDAELFSQFLSFAKMMVKKKGPFTFAVSPRETRANATARAFFKTITAEKFPKVRYHWSERFSRLSLSSSPLNLPSDAVVFITGGLSGIGLAVAEYIAYSASIRAMVLVSRRSPDVETQKRIDEMRKRTDVIVLSTDIAKAESLKASLQSIPHKITHVIHSAGIIKDAMLIRQTPALFDAVYAPKVSGLETLERTLLALDHPLQHVIAMSSIAAVLGNTGQSNYSVSNGLLDHWARSAAGHSRTAVNWGNWREIGMAVHVQDQLDAMGLEGLKPEDGVRYVGYVLNERPTQLTVSRMDWSSLVAFRKDLPDDLLQAAVSQSQNQDFCERPEAKVNGKSQKYEKLVHIEVAEHDRPRLRPSGILVDQSRLPALKADIARGRIGFADLVVNYLPDMGHAALYLAGDDLVSVAAAKPEVLDARSTASKLVMLFPGQGAQYPLMAAQLSRVFPAFRDAFDACVRAADAASAYSPSLKEIAKRTELYLELQKTSVTQILLFAHSYACFALWKSLGIQPDFLLGHSIGELVAVAASGILSVEDAVAVVLKRGEAMERCKGRGAMMALDRNHLEAILKRFPALYLAADNTTKQAVVAGDRRTIDAALAHLKSQRVTSAIINEQYPFHTPLITEKDLAEYAKVLDSVTFREGSIPIVRNVDGKLSTTFTKEYLMAQARSAVLFVPSVATLVSSGVRTWLEAGHSFDFDHAYPSLAAFSMTNGFRLRQRLSESGIYAISDHLVRNVPVVPGTYHIHRMHKLINGMNDGKVAVLRDGVFRSIWTTASADYVISRSPSGAVAINVRGIRVSTAQAAIIDAPPTPACDLGDKEVEQDVAVFYQQAARFGLLYGPKFRVMQKLFFTGRRSQSYLAPCCHQAVALDGALHSIAALTLREKPDHVYVPEGFKEIYFGPYNPSKPAETAGILDSLDNVYAHGSMSVYQEGVLVLQVRGIIGHRLIQPASRPSQERKVSTKDNTPTPAKPSMSTVTESQSAQRKNGSVTAPETGVAVCTVRVESAVAVTKIEASQDIPKPVITRPSAANSNTDATPSSNVVNLPEPISATVPKLNVVVQQAVTALPHIIGHDGNFCLDAHGNAATWDQLKNGRTTNRAVYKHREKIGREAAFIDRDLSLFDPEFFGISPIEALYMDPLQRHLLLSVQASMENAGIAQLPSSTGIFIGTSTADFVGRMMVTIKELNGYCGAGTNVSALAGRIAHWLKAEGPVITFDTACSSSFTSLIVACDALRDGKCEYAIVGAATMIFLEHGTEVLTRAGMMSPDFACKVMDASANGYLRGEAAASILLYKDSSLGGSAIKAWAIGHNGVSSALAAPNGKRQEKLMATVYKEPLTWREAHMTGTSLGDPIETGAIARANGGAEVRVSSIKSALGHSEAVAGLASLVSVLSQLHADYYLPQLHYACRNPKMPDSVHFDAIGSDGIQERQLTVNSFGFTGTNTVILLGREEKRSRQPSSGRSVLIPLSVYDPVMLEQYVQQVEQFLADSSLSIDAIAVVLQRGRAHRRHRVALVVDHRRRVMFRSAPKKKPQPLALEIFGGGLDVVAKRLARSFNFTMEGKDAAASIKSLLLQLGLPLKFLCAADTSQFVADGVRVTLTSSIPPEVQVVNASTLTPVGVLSLVADAYAARVAINWDVLSSASARPSAPIIPSAMNLRPFWPELRADLDQALYPEYEIGLELRDLVSGEERKWCGDRLPGADPLPAFVSHSRTPNVLIMYPPDMKESKLLADIALRIIEVWKEVERHGGVVVVARRNDGSSHLQVSALLRSLASESRGVNYKVIGYDTVEEVAAELRDHSINEVVIYNKGVRYVQRLTPMEKPAASPKIRLGRVLISGGSGGIGQFILSHLRPAESIVLSRSGAPVGGATRTIKGDCCKKEALETLNEIGDVDRVFHCAGSVANALRHSQTDVLMLTVLQPKVDGFINFTAAAGAAGVDVMSSSAVVLGSAGQTNYAFANGWMADEAERAGHRAVHWGPWRDAGMLAGGELESIRRQIEEGGWRMMEAARAVRHLATGDRKSRLVMDADWSKIVGRQPHLAPFLERICAAPAATTDAPPTAADAAAAHQQAAGETVEEIIARVSGLTTIERDLGFMTIGIDSLMIEDIRNQIKLSFGMDLSVADIYDNSTLERLEKYVDSRKVVTIPVEVKKVEPLEERSNGKEEIAIIGYSGAFSGARSVEEFWDRLYRGEECIWRGEKKDDDEENIVRAGGLVEGIDEFDNGFFHITKDDAALIEPQIRTFVQHSYAALERSGYVKDRSTIRTGVWASAEPSEYSNGEGEARGTFGRMYSMNQKDFVAAWTAHLLDLRGSATGVYTACSSALLAMDQACSALKEGKVDLALAGAVSLQLPELAYYEFQPGNVLSPDGKCCPFDENARGIVRGSSVACLVMKRLSEAIRDGDTIHAVVKAIGVSNDGVEKASFMAPNRRGMRECMEEALRQCDDDVVDTIKFVECHGTGTSVGDEMELSALRDVYRSPISIGSVKANIGHCFAGAGLAGVVKGMAILKRREIPPQINFTRFHPRFGDTGTLNIATAPERIDEQRFHVAVSSFGIGGTNGHIVLGAAPRDQHRETVLSTPPSRVYILPVSARSKEACRRLCARVADHLEQGAELSTVASTLQQRREFFKHRVAIVARDTDEAIARLRDVTSVITVSGADFGNDGLAFYFAPQGVQYPHMERATLDLAPTFERTLEKMSAICKEKLPLDLFREIYPRDGEESRIKDADLAQIVIFSLCQAIAQQLSDFGIEADRLVGHSVGEYAAMAYAEAATPAELLGLLIERSRLVATTPKARMFAVRGELPALPADIEISAHLSTNMRCIVGPPSSIEAFTAVLLANGLEWKELETAHGFHSYMLEPILPRFDKELRKIRFKKMRKTLISNVDGAPRREITADYCKTHMRREIRIDKCVEALKTDKKTRVVLQIGPAGVLENLLAQSGIPVVNTCNSKRNHERFPDRSQLFEALGQLWCHGYRLNFERINPGEGFDEKLPTYAFDPIRCWKEPGKGAVGAGELTNRVFNQSWAPLAIKPIPIDGKKVVIFTNGDAQSELATLLLCLKDKKCSVMLSNTLGEESISAASGYSPDIVLFVIRDAPHTLEDTFFASFSIRKNILSVRPVPFLIIDLVASPMSSTTMGSLREQHLLAPGLSVYVDNSLRAPLLPIVERLAAGAAADQLLVMPAGRLLQLAYTDATAPDTEDMRLHGCVLVLGGAGAIGKSLVREVLHRAKEATTVIVASRSAAAKLPSDLLTLAEERGHILEAINMDVLDKDQVVKMVNNLDRLTTVINVVGLPPVENLEKPREEVLKVLQSKIVSTNNVLAALEKSSTRLENLILISSLSALLGLQGTEEYAAANGYLDALASTPPALVENVLSIQWPAWKGDGMASDNHSPISSLLNDGVISHAEGRRLFRESLKHRGVVAVAKIHPIKLKYEIGRRLRGAPDENEEETTTDDSSLTPFEIVRDVWRSILSAAEVKESDNFFEIGGNSLNALQISWAVNKRLHCSSRVNLLFDFPVFSEFVRKVMKEANKGDDSIKLIGKTAKMPLTYAQDNMFLLKQLEKGTHYNIVFSTEVEGAMDERAMRAALLAVVARQHSMRSVFTQHGMDEPTQSALSLTESYQLLEYTEMSEERYRQLVATELAWEFDLASIPLRILAAKIGNRYAIVFSQHHIITDGWSMTILARELTAAYHHFIGRGERLPPLPVSIADIAGWQRAEQNVAALKSDLEALKERLAGKKATRILPTKTRPLKTSKNCDKLSVMLPKEVVDSANALAAKQKSTAYAVFLAHFLRILRAWSEEEERDDVVIGCPVSGRSRPEMNDIVGYFLNNSIIDVEVKVDEAVESVVEKVKQRTTENRRFERIPYQHLVAALDTRESRDELPFYIYFNFRNDLDFPKIDIHGLQSKVKQLSMARIFETSFTLDETPEGMRVLIEYNTDVFTRDAMTRFLEDYAAALSGNPRLPKPIVAPRVEYPAQSLIQSIRHQVTLTPDAPTLIGLGEPMTYAQLWEAAAAATALLQDEWFAAVGECLRADDIVPMATAPNDIFVPMLAALICGAAYAPLDPKWPEARIEGVREAVNAPFVFTNEWVEQGGGGRRRAVRMRSLPEDLLYIIHTSGSTGKPKGVCITNENLCAFTAEATRQTMTRPFVTLLQSVNSAFDVSKFNMFTSLTNGASLHRPRDLTRTVDEAAEIGAENLFLNGALFNSLSDKDAAKLRSVRRVIVGGETVQDNAIQRMVTNGIEFIEIWGPSEVTIWSTAYRVKAGESGLHLGYIMINEGIALVEKNRDLQRGHVGEAVQIGDKVGRGYLHNALPGKFVPNPYRTREDEALERNAIAYHSGDRVRVKEGILRFVGRRDKQIKSVQIRGQRIELREIEVAIVAAASVINTAVVLKVDERLVAFIITPDATVKTTLLSSLRSTLPSYMIPSEVVLIESVPRTHNGKVDSAALSAMVQVCAVKEAIDYEEGSTLERLQRVWASVLLLSSFHPTDDFFSSGGHSLLIFQLRAKVEEEFGLSLDLVDLIETRGPVAALTKNKAAPSREILTAVWESSDATHNIYAIHAIGGTIFPYFGFSKIFPAQFNIYAIEYFEDYPGETIEELAAFYAENIARHASSTPYFVMGHSMGGHLSREIAIVLNLPFIVALDTWYARPGILRLNVIEAFLKDAFAILPNPEVLVQRGLRLGKILMDYDPKKSSTKIYLLKAERLGRSALQGVIRNDVTEDMVRAMRYNGLEDLSEQEIDVVTVPGDHEAMLSGRNLALYAKDLIRPFLENM
ncbi:hypothetical protein PENTCL1PPCAC_25305, partial [Pristionchus entomophagus]